LGTESAAALGLKEVESEEVAWGRESVVQVAPWVRPQVVAEKCQGHDNPLLQAKITCKEIQQDITKSGLSCPNPF
jgi:hypothetical protein